LCVKYCFKKHADIETASVNNDLIKASDKLEVNHYVVQEFSSYVYQSSISKPDVIRVSE